MVDLEQEAVELRIKLRAAQVLWLTMEPPPIGLSKILIEPPIEIHEGIGQRQRLVEAWQAPWQALFDRLLVDVEADFDHA